MTGKKILGAALLGGAAACGAALYGCFWGCFAPKKYLASDAPPSGGQYEAKKSELAELYSAAKALDFERVSIRARDGVGLSGRYYRFSGAGPVVLFFHGYRSSPIRDGCGMLKLMRELKLDVLAPDQRAHGESGGHAITMGVKEQYDCLDWIQYILDRFGNDREIILGGCSMGAATVMMASDMLPDNVLGIIADCGYTTPEEIMRSVGRARGLPEGPAMAMIRGAARLFGGFDLRAASAPEALSRCGKPVLFIHGAADDFVPTEMSRVNYAACAGPKRLLEVPGAEHAMSFVVDEEGYTSAVKEFLAECGVEIPQD